jgi:hypothetical protein
MNRENDQVEYRQVIKVTEVGPYEKIKLTRLKYKNNTRTFIDFRVYERPSDKEGDSEYFATKKGITIKEDLFLTFYADYFIEKLKELLQRQ